MPLCLVLAGLLLTGCADTTESLTWWSDTEENEPVPGEDEDFPNLGSVPDAPEEITSIEVIEQVEQSLLADSANAQYLTGSFARVGDETSIEPMPEIVVEEVIEEEIVEEEEIVVEETADGEVIEEVIEEEEVIIEEEEIVVDETASTAVVETEEMTVDVAETTTEEVVAVEEAPVEEPVVEAAVVEEEIVAEPEPGTVVMETTVVTPAPEVLEPVGSPDEALPPQAVTRAVAVTDIVEEPAAMVQAETVVVEEAVIVEAPAPQSGMSQTFDTLFAASGPDAAEGGENPVPEFVEADVATVETPAPTITPTGYQTLVAVIRFNLGSTALDDNDRDIVQAIADAHRQRGGHIRLAGFASKDSDGSEDTEEMLENFNLSVDRATAVADELVRRGVASDAIVIDAQGDSSSSGLAQTQSGAAEQRRVDVYFTN